MKEQERAPRHDIGVIFDLFNSDTDILPRIPSGSRGAFVAWGLCMYLIHQAGAVLTLEEKDMTFATSPNRRTMIEYLIRLLWVADSPEAAVDALNHDLQTILGRLMRAARAAGSNVPQEALATAQATMNIDLEAAGEKSLLKTKQVTDEYGLATHYLWWISDTQWAHPSLISVKLFFKEIDGNRIELHREPHNFPAEMPGAEFCLWVLFQAALAFNSLLTKHPWTEPLRSIAAAHGFSMELPNRRPPM